MNTLQSLRAKQAHCPKWVETFEDIPNHTECEETCLGEPVVHTLMLGPWAVSEPMVEFRPHWACATAQAERLTGDAREERLDMVATAIEEQFGEFEGDTLEEYTFTELTELILRLQHDDEEDENDALRPE